MSKRSLTSIDFRVDGKTVESIRTLDPPQEGETVEVGAKFVDGERVDPNEVDSGIWHHEAEYETVLEGEVTNVTRHYHSSFGRYELTVFVDVEPFQS